MKTQRSLIALSVFSRKTPALRGESSARPSDSTSAVVRRILTAAVALTLWVGGANPADAQVLTGNGANLPAPTAGNTFATFPGVLPTLVDNGSNNFTLTWSSAAQAAWVGSYTVTGPYPAGTVATGLANFNFSTLPNGFLPANSHIALSDLDNGSGTENVTVKAYSGTTAATIIRSPWLNSPTLVYASTGSGGGGAAILTDMPGWDWNATTFTYSFTGGTVTGNPNINMTLFSNVNIGSFDVTRDNTFSHFGLGAPSAIPEPSTYAAIAGAAMLGFAGWRRRSRKNSPAGTQPVATV